MPQNPWLDEGIHVSKFCFCEPPFWAAHVFLTSLHCMKNLLIKGLPLFALASITLGLAPFFPEPHVWEKIRWIATGQPMDLPIYWFDFAMHGLPWVLLLISGLLRLSETKAEKESV